MRIAEIICTDARTVASGDPQNACEMSRRNGAASPPTIDCDRLNTAFEGNLFTWPDTPKNIFDLIFHASQNDYISHNVKWLIQ